VSWYNASPTIMGRTPPEGLVMAKRWFAPSTHAIWGGMWPYVIWKQSWNNWKIPLVESSRWKQSWRCLETIQKRTLANKCGMCWNVNLKELEKKNWSLGPTCSFWRKAGSSHLIWDVMWWELRSCQRTWVQEKMVPKRDLPKNIHLHG